MNYKNVNHGYLIAINGTGEEAGAWLRYYLVQSPMEAVTS
jgi:hypothetical protein